MKYAILTVDGKDRPGIIASSTNYLTKRHGDIEKEKGYVLNEDYSVASFIFGATSVWMRKIEADLEELKPFNARLTPTKSSRKREERPIEYQLNVFAPGERGMSASIERSIAAADINIVSVDGGSREVPGIPSKVYTSTFDLRVPSARSIRQLREDIFALESKSCWDFDLHSSQVVPKPKYMVVEKFTVAAGSEMHQGRSSRFSG